MCLRRSLISISVISNRVFKTMGVAGWDMTFDLFAEIDGEVFEEEFKDTHLIAEP